MCTFWPTVSSWLHFTPRITHFPKLFTFDPVESADVNRSWLQTLESADLFPSGKDGVKMVQISTITAPGTCFITRKPIWLEKHKQTLVHFYMLATSDLIGLQPQTYRISPNKHSLRVDSHLDEFWGSCSFLTNFRLFWGKYSIRKCWEGAPLSKQEHLFHKIQ